VAIYHLHVKVLTRSKGHSALKASAYRAGADLRDLDGSAISYSRRQDAEALSIYTRSNHPDCDWVYDRQSLWASIERAEKRKDAQLAREVEFALPIELCRQDQRSCALRMAEYITSKFDVPLDISIHYKEGNPHCHILIPLRTLGPDGWGQKIREMNRKEFVLELRKAWQDIANEYLAGIARIDCRSYEEQDIKKVPQKHLGKRLYKYIKRYIIKGIVKMAGRVLADTSRPEVLEWLAKNGYGPTPKADPQPAPEPQQEQTVQKTNENLPAQRPEQKKNRNRGRGGLEL
jgi:hypothetical protein